MSDNHKQNPWQILAVASGLVALYELWHWTHRRRARQPASSHDPSPAHVEVHLPQVSTYHSTPPGPDLDRIADPLLRLTLGHPWLVIALHYALRTVLEYLVVYRGQPLRLDTFLPFAGADKLFLFSNLTCLLAALVLKRLFSSLLPAAFEKPVETGLILPSHRSAYSGFLHAVSRRLNSPARLALSLPLAGLFVHYYFWLLRPRPPLLSTLLRTGRRLSEIETTILWGCSLYTALFGILMGYCIGVVIWRVLVSVLAVRSLGRKFDLALQPDHPDGCAGLKPIGDLCLSIALAIIVAALYLAWETVSLQRSAHIDDLNLTMARLGLISVSAFSLLAFFYPIHHIHRQMVSFRDRHRAQLQSALGQLNQLESQLMQDIQRGSPLSPHAAQQIEALVPLRAAYQARYEVPVWPVNRKMFLQLFSLETIPILTAIGITADVVDVWELVRKAIR